MNSVWHFPNGYSGFDCQACAGRIRELESWIASAAAQLGELEKQIADLRQRQAEAQSRIGEMQSRIEDLQSKPPLHVEYHFDQLKVSRLDGTLNIGISPNAKGDVDSFDVPAPGTWQTPAVGTAGSEPLIPRLIKLGNDMFDKEAAADLAAAASKNGVSFPASEIQMVTKDVRDQLGPRIQYYARTSPLPEETGEKAIADWEREVIGKVRKDVRAAFENYAAKRAPQPPQERP
ncbi:spore germination protein GerPC [Cohnella hashimotonis]|uniref:Spore germination protein GerPC n=1 Tax=Cohnella hashimotonis TaxID=2826895 RepID=A0ABT6TER1_9BACL|nr:spore germination protein GerPC [Cohnella hashimotonis]MDI4645328.1 spore germination protein GerPC [Cohnella hashimotonis]